MPTNSVYVNCFESVCCAGESSEALFEAICTHQSGIKSFNEFIPNKSIALGKIEKPFSIESLLAVTCKKVLVQSSLENFENTLLVVGSSVGGMQRSELLFLRDHHYANIDPKLHAIDAIAHILSQHFTFKDDISFSTACTSSANALGYGYEMIAKGVYESVLVVGIDTLSLTTIRGFDALGVLSSRPCQPFDMNRDGMNVAEGIAVVLLQNTPCKESIEFLGAGYSSDAHHMAHPSPDGEGALLAMQKALQCAHIMPSEVGYINAHGTGTQANDTSEACAIARLFGDKVSVSSTKSITGHTLGAAGALEAIVCAMALQKQILPPNTNLFEPENKTLNLVNAAKSRTLRYALSNSLAFGGNNTALLFGLPQ
ncbi:beta-ketoacyl-[acyl-carrier-protein] synthase family protein [Sulfurospirillum diekertiae]|uniref:Beta-ketoacyl-[acyl-carrier-protein] synthase family protein n=1 Tax=Sulfurospirillum diekertiae TaxID=1854492 RepID=A0A6G9VR06_9BACT|nr:beta-ketoacyl-[acyl-carrier-protein] synthase family protein [Sulfurospirillum diekertiae]QIR75784.1 beta-ketoacyl-[acyl-carrier-protein] synthase family protein [Sulfurospirillum diekertiae]QIR78429.1 beta-ketoacyl-[acyl-carrier-protein] synthase family protein [Sulfurospirillum diekertiae]